MEFDERYSPNFVSGHVDSKESKIKYEADQARAEREMAAAQQQPQNIIDNPFGMQQYNNFSKIPDQPISNGNNMADALLNDNEVPDDIRNKFWFIFHKDNVLTFLDKERKSSKLTNYDIEVIDILNTTPYYGYTFAHELEFDIIRNVLETKLDRAVGFAGNIKNERTTLQSQFQESRNVIENTQNEGAKTGFFKRILSRK